MVSSRRYTFKMDGGRRVKIRKMELYEFDGMDGFNLMFQEQPAGGSGRGHTHVWIRNEENPELVEDLYMYVTWIFEMYPQKTTLFALVRGWELSEDETVFEGPDTVYELVMERKLSKTHVDHLFDWLGDVLSEMLLWRGMDGLFGDDASGGSPGGSS